VKRLLPLLFAFFAVSAQAESCTKIDYQELKDYTDKELLSKYCKDKDGFKFYSLAVEFNQKMYKLSQSLKDDRGMTEALESWGESADSSNQCKSEVDRVLRLLQQKNIDEAAAGAQCSLLVTPSNKAN